MKVLQEGDVLTAKEVVYIGKLQGLCDSLSTAVENGELDDFKCSHPQAYSDLVERMAELQGLESNLQRHDHEGKGAAHAQSRTEGHHAPL